MMCYSEFVCILCLQAHEKSESLQTEISSVDKVTQEDEILLAVSANCVFGRVCVGCGSDTPPVVDAPASTSFLLLIVIAFFIAITARRTRRPGVIGVALEPPLHLALYFGICYACGRLEIGGVNCAW